MRPRNRHHRATSNESLAKLMTPFLKRFSRRFAAGSFVYKEDETANHIFFIVNGLVKLTKKCVAQKEQQVSIVHPQKITGMEAVFPYGYYYCSAIAVTECVICAVPKEEFLKEFYHYNTSTLLIMDEMYNDINKAEEKIYNIEAQLLQSLDGVHRNIL